MFVVGVLVGLTPGNSIVSALLADARGGGHTQTRR